MLNMPKLDVVQFEKYQFNTPASLGQQLKAWRLYLDQCTTPDNGDWIRDCHQKLICYEIQTSTVFRDGIKRYDSWGGRNDILRQLGLIGHDKAHMNGYNVIHADDITDEHLTVKKCDFTVPCPDNVHTSELVQYVLETFGPYSSDNDLLEVAKVLISRADLIQHLLENPKNIEIFDVLYSLFKYNIRDDEYFLNLIKEKKLQFKENQYLNEQAIVDGSIKRDMSEKECLSVIDQAALDLNFDLLKQYVAMDPNPQVNEEVLKELILGTDFRSHARQGYNIDLRNDIILYLLNTCRFNEYLLSTKLVEGIQGLDHVAPKKPEGMFKPKFSTVITEWLSLQNNRALLEHPVFQRLIRFSKANELVTSAILEDDIEYFDEIMQKLFSNKVMGNLFEYIFGSSADLIRGNLRDIYYGGETLAEYLTSNFEYKGIILSAALQYIEQPLSMPMLVKLLEHGVLIEDFERHVGMDVRTWCEQNYCIDLLENNDIRNRIEMREDRLELMRFFAKKCHVEQFPRLVEDRMIAFIDKYYSDKPSFGANCVAVPLRSAVLFEIEGIEHDYQDNTNPWQVIELWSWAALNNMPRLLQHSGLLDNVTSGKITKPLHNIMLRCAINGANETLEILIQHARKYAPAALRFSREEIEKVNAENKRMANVLIESTKPVSFGQSLLTSFVNAASLIIPSKPYELKVNDHGLDLDVRGYPERMQMK